MKELELELVEKIRIKAAEVHSNVNQYYDNDKPYVFHLNTVWLWAVGFMPDEADPGVICFACFFHDTIEDARLTYNDVLKIARELLGDNSRAQAATEIVYALTNEKGRNRAERANEKYYQGIRETPWASFVKVCDRLANAYYAKQHGTGMWKKYQEESEHFINSVGDIPEKVKNPRELRSLRASEVYEDQLYPKDIEG